MTSLNAKVKRVQETLVVLQKRGLKIETKPYIKNGTVTSRVTKHIHVRPNDGINTLGKVDLLHKEGYTIHRPSGQVLFGKIF